MAMDLLLELLMISRTKCNLGEWMDPILGQHVTISKTKCNLGEWKDPRLGQHVTISRTKCNSWVGERMRDCVNMA